jgi:acetoin utilization deacetylase AcuC-like enzyme
MRKIGFFYNPIFIDHDTGPGHPESPERLKAIVSAVKSDPVGGQLTHISSFPRRAPESLYSVHDESYVSSVRSAVEGGARVLDFGDTTVSGRSYDAALIAADAAVEAAIQVWKGSLDRAFCALRPPGHHAERKQAMGFCLFNNIAVAAANLLEQGVNRIAIIDWDVHHGNGTQHAFENTDRVLFISLHQYPHYPGTGSRDEDGVGNGKGYTINFPMYMGTGEPEYMAIFDTEIVPALNVYKPDIILVSAGFDAHRNDPLAGISLETETYAKMTQRLLDVAEKHCKGRLVSYLEGGYNLPVLTESVLAHLREMVDFP